MSVGGGERWGEEVGDEVLGGLGSEKSLVKGWIHHWGYLQTEPSPTSSSLLKSLTLDLQILKKVKGFVWFLAMTVISLQLNAVFTSVQVPALQPAWPFIIHTDTLTCTIGINYPQEVHSKEPPTIISHLFWNTVLGNVGQVNEKRWQSKWPLKPRGKL